MKNKKALLIIIGTVLISFLSGFLVSGVIHHHKIKSIMQCADKDGFIKMIYKKIDASEEQKLQLDPILKKYAEKSTLCLKNHRLIIDSLHTEILPFLTFDQKEKMDQCNGCSGGSCSMK